MWKKLNNNKKKGFTLVELIVVLVILAILAALLIPALTGYIDKAREKNVIAETRQAVMAAQTLVDEKYAARKNNTDAITVEENGTVKYDDVKKLAETKGTISAVTVAGANDSEGVAAGTIKTLTYTDGVKTCVYKAATKDTEATYTVN